MISEPVTRELCDYIDAVRETLPAGVRLILFNASVFVPLDFLTPAANDAAFIEFARLQFARAVSSLNIPRALLGSHSNYSSAAGSRSRWRGRYRTVRAFRHKAVLDYVASLSSELVG